MPRDNNDDVELSKDQIKKFMEATNEYATQLIAMQMPANVRRAIGAGIAYRSTYHVQNLTRGQQKQLYRAFADEGE